MGRDAMEGGNQKMSIRMGKAHNPLIEAEEIKAWMSSQQIL